MSELRDRYLASLRDFDATGEPPDADLVWDAVSGALPPEKRREVVDRVATDPGWAEAWRLAAEIWSSTEEGRRALGATASSASLWQRNRFLAAAASLAVLVGAGLVVREVLAPEPSFRNPATPSIQSLVPESTPLPRDRVVLEWSSAGAGARYDVTVTSESLEVLAQETDLEEPRYRVPESALEGMAAGGRLFWQVSARSPDGPELRSPTFVVVVE